MKEERFYVRDRRLPYHYTIDNEVYDMMLGVYALGVYNAFARHASYEGDTREQADLSHRQLAKELRCGVTSIKKGIRTLQRAGLVKIEKIVGGSSTYVLLEVPKQVYKKKYLRRAGEKGGQNTPTHTDSAVRRNTTTPRRQATTPGRQATTPGRQATTPKRSKDSADKGVREDSRGSKKKILKGKLGGASRPSSSTHQEDLNVLAKRVVNWHIQCGKNTGKTYNLNRVGMWLGVRIRQLGIEKVTEVFERVANGANPYIDGFWKALKKEAKERKVKAPPVEVTMLNKPIQVAG